MFFTAATVSMKSNPDSVLVGITESRWVSNRDNKVEGL